MTCRLMSGAGDWIAGSATFKLGFLKVRGAKRTKRAKRSASYRRCHTCRASSVRRQTRGARLRSPATKLALLGNKLPSLALLEERHVGGGARRH